MKRTLSIAVLAGCLSMPALAQAPPGAADRDLKNKIDARGKQLEDDARRDLEDREWEDQLDAAARAIRGDLTRFIETQARPSDPAAVIERRLRAVLKDQERIDEDSDEATARQLSLFYGRSLVVAYTIPRPLHEDTAEIYGFTEDHGRYRIVATTGLKDFEHFSLSTREVPSPNPGVVYLLAWGQRMTANFAPIRFRLYTFDGATFSTIWAPDILLSATVTVTPRGFDIKHLDRTRGEFDVDRYQTTLNGVIRIP